MEQENNEIYGYGSEKDDKGSNAGDFKIGDNIHRR